MIGVNRKWICASYLINAKKDIDSLMYWRDNFEKVSNIDNMTFVDSKRRDFYLNLTNLLEKTKKRDKSDPILCSILDLRNMKYAHDDDTYYEKEFESKDELINYMIEQIEYVRKVCASSLPEGITLDYVSHDPMLFRFVHGINPAKEKELFNKKHPSAAISSPTATSKTYKSFNDINQIKNIPKEELNEYGVIVNDGLTNYEGLQNRQDSCIKINVLYGTDMWCTPNHDVLRLIGELEDIGFVDKYGITHIDEMSPEGLEVVRELFDKYERITDE